MNSSKVLALALVLAPAATVFAQDVPKRRWVAGDLHEHVTPPDRTTEVSATLPGVLEAARSSDMGFVILTPHLRGDWWSEGDAARRVSDLAALCERASKVEDVCVIPGYEDTRRDGHVGVAFLDSRVLAAVEPGRARTRGVFLEELARAGALLTINHPVAGTNPRAALPELRWDMSWKPWTRNLDDPDAARIEAAATSVEVLNGGISMAEAATGTPVGERQIDRAFRILDKRLLASGHRLAPVGGSDNHAFWLMPTTWISVPDHGRRAGKPIPPSSLEVREALVRGRVCTGGPEAGSLEVRVRGTSGPWAGIGDELSAEGRELDVRWEGKGELFLDGRSLGTFDGHATVTPAPGSRHHLRLVSGFSASGYVFVDWKDDAPRARVYR
jgi:hypothetical protein